MHHNESRQLNLTQDQIDILSDTSLGISQKATLLNMRRSQVNYRMKRLGVPFPGKNSKRPYYKKRNLSGENRTCKNVNCENVFYTTISDNRKYCCKFCLFSCESYKQLLREMDKSYMQTEEYRSIMRKPDTPQYVRFRNSVAKLTEKVYKEHKSIINPNDYPRTIAGTEGGYQIDHKTSIRFGFDNGLSIEELCEVTNLQMLPWRENVVKGASCH